MRAAAPKCRWNQRILQLRAARASTRRRIPMPRCQPRRERVNDPHFYDSGRLVAIGNLYIDSSGKRDATG
jgi:hypothetical protein